MTTMISNFECVDPPAALGQAEEFFLACDADNAGQVVFVVQPSHEFRVSPGWLAVTVGHTARVVPLTLTRLAGTSVRAIITAQLGATAFKSTLVEVK
jgi:hypothetical protein